jgi:hypothetical protein
MTSVDCVILLNFNGEIVPLILLVLSVFPSLNVFDKRSLSS